MDKKLLVVALMGLSLQTFADYKDDIGYKKIQAELGLATPDGSGVTVTQVEAAIGSTETNVGAWAPNVTSSQFSGKNIIDKSVPVSNGMSRHATGVGGLFYGNNAMAFGIVDVDVYSASDWISNGFLKIDRNSKPLLSDSRIANHSWVGSMKAVGISAEDAKNNTVKVLQRVDWLIEENEFIQVTAMNNGSANKPLLGSAYNSIAVGRTDANHAQGSVALGSVYTSGQTRPDVVAPIGTTSSATPIVSSAVSMLIEQAHSAAQGDTSIISNGDAIYNGERSEVIKAIIMTGADRVTSNISTTAQISDFRGDIATQTANGLDSRYGAGQLNVFNNYQIMAGGEQNSLEDGGEATVGMMGYDYDNAFGGALGANGSASYFFETIIRGNLQLTASLVWNIDIEDTGGFGFNPDATLYDLDLFLFDVTTGSESLLSSSSSDIDNSENIWFFLEQSHDYRIDVLAADGSSFNWDYGLAWQVSAVPVPAAVWFFISGLFSLFSIRRARLMT